MQVPGPVPVPALEFESCAHRRKGKEGKEGRRRRGGWFL